MDFADGWERIAASIRRQIVLRSSAGTTKFFAKLKHWLRKAARRNIDAVGNAIGRILEDVTPAECSNYFANAGYGRT
jgi:hypothetical protein